MKSQESCIVPTTGWKENLSMQMTTAIALNGMTASDKRQEVTANNIANLTTDGFKSQLADQSTLLTQGTRINGVRENLVDIGKPRQTNQDTDFYIRGDGFLQVQLAEGIGYTRAGNLKIDSLGNLAMPNGNLIEPNITVPPEATRLEVTSQGDVRAIMPDGSAEDLGQLQLVRFTNVNGLESIGDNIYVATEAAGVALTGTPGEEGFGAIDQYMLEGSNVDLTTELTEMMVNQRYQQANLRVMKTADSIIGRAIDTFT